MTKATNQDEILYCARCGISFVWSLEEQKVQDALQPRHCPACRHLLPTDGRERGLIELYLHRSEIQGRRVPAVVDLVEFAVAVTHKGPQAVEAVLISAPPPPAGP